MWITRRRQPKALISDYTKMKRCKKACARNVFREACLCQRAVIIGTMALLRRRRRLMHLAILSRYSGERMQRNYGIAARPYHESREKLVDRIYVVLFGILLLGMTMGLAGTSGAVIWWLFFK